MSKAEDKVTDHLNDLIAVLHSINVKSNTPSNSREECVVVEFSDETINSSEFTIVEFDDVYESDCMTVGTAWINTRNLPALGDTLYIGVDYVGYGKGEQFQAQCQSLIGTHWELVDKLKGFRNSKYTLPARLKYMAEILADSIDNAGDAGTTFQIDGKWVEKVNTESVHVTLSARPDRQAFMTLKFTTRMFKELFGEQ
jgi:hypothetical protein